VDVALNATGTITVTPNTVRSKYNTNIVYSTRSSNGWKQTGQRKCPNTVTSLKHNNDQ
jgi:hypothetical protein